MKQSAIFSSLLLLTFAVPAQAAFDCSASVQNLLVYKDGMVNVRHSGRGDYTMICSLNADYGGVSPMVCANWVALLESVKKRNGLAHFYYDGAGSCATLPTYGSAPIPVYIGDVTQ